ncbi:MAG TPA: VOC family protein [Streptosporangiaceae bacterium]
MAHYSGLRKIVIDVPAAAHEQELAFWQAAIGQPLVRFEKFPEYHGADLPGQQIGLLVQHLTDGPGRVHLDIHTDDLAAELARLERLGARRVRQVHAWWIMQDPAGLPFCVIPEPPGSLNGDNAQLWE